MKRVILALATVVVLGGSSLMLTNRTSATPEMPASCECDPATCCPCDGSCCG